MPAAIVAGDTALAEYAALLRDDFASFAARSFRELNPRIPFAANWHFELMAGKLAAVREGRIRRLIVNVPPRHLKLHLASVAFPAWCLGHDPSMPILCLSYAQDLADKLSRDCRRIVASDWYRRLFPTRLSPRHQAVPEFETTAQGCRIATSVGGVLTGRGADIIIIDDPLKPEEALSQAQRRSANEWYDHTLYSRLNDKLTGAIVLIMHRLHEDDLAGHVLAQEPWEVVRLPAIADEEELHRVETVFGRQSFDRKAGEALHPEREPQEMIEQIRRTLGNIISPASTSRPRHHRAAAWSSRRGSGITHPTSGPRNSTALCRAGTPPIRRASSAISASAPAGDQGQGPLSAARAAPAHGISRIEARGARAVPGIRGECGVDRGQGLGHPAHPGIGRAGPARGPATSRSPIRSCACTRRRR